MKAFFIKYLLSTILDLLIGAVKEKAKDTFSPIDDSFAKCLEDNKDDLAALIRSKL